MDIERVLEFIQKEAPNHANELWEAIGLVTEVIDNTEAAMMKKLTKYLQDGNEKSDEIYPMIKEITKINQYITSLSDQYRFNEENDNFDQDCSSEKFEDNNININSEKINYEEYRVDENVEYSIYTDFQNTKPSGFQLQGMRYDANSWYKMTLKVCELLYTNNVSKFEDVVRSYSIKGKKKAYIAFEDDPIAKTILEPKRLLNTQIVIEQVLNANQHRDIIAKLLEKFSIQRSTFKIYLRTDTRMLHNSEKVSCQQEKKLVDTKVKDTIYNNKDDFRFSKPQYIQESNPQQNGLKDKIGTPSHIEYLKMSEHDDRRHKNRCSNYDNKKSVCMCEKSPYFTMHCGGSSHCKYYSEVACDN